MNNYLLRYRNTLTYLLTYLHGVTRVRVMLFHSVTVVTVATLEVKPTSGDQRVS